MSFRYTPFELPPILSHKADLLHRGSYRESSAGVTIKQSEVAIMKFSSQKFHCVPCKNVYYFANELVR